MCSWSRAAQVPDRISDPQILDSFRFPGFPQQRSLSGGKQRRNSASSEEAPAAQLPRPGGVGCCVEKTAALSDLKTCTTSGICDSVFDSSVALPDALALSRGSPVQAVWTPRIASPGLARVRDIVHVVSLYNIYTDFTSQSSSRSATAILSLQRAPGRGAVRRRHKSDVSSPGRDRAI